MTKTTQNFLRSFFFTYSMLATGKSNNANQEKKTCMFFLEKDNIRCVSLLFFVCVSNELM